MPDDWAKRLLQNSKAVDSSVMIFLVIKVVLWCKSKYMKKSAQIYISMFILTECQDDLGKTLLL